MTAVDVLIVGAGLSGATLAEELLRGAGGAADAAGARIAAREGDGAIVVAEATGRFWGGVAYGPASGPHALIISPLGEFLPEPWLGSFRSWAARYGWSVDSGSFVSRALFGKYLSDRMQRVAAEAGPGRLRQLGQRVRALRPASPGWTATLQDGTTLAARAVVLCIGAPGPRPIPGPPGALGGPLVVQDLYGEPGGLEAEVRTVAQRLDALSRPGRVMVAGTQASALEFLWRLTDRARNPFTVRAVSSEARFPATAASAAEAASACIPVGELRTGRLLTAPTVTAEDILRATRSDLAQLAARGVPAGAAIGATAPLLPALFERLSQEERDVFVAGTGRRIGRLHRVAGRWYRSSWDALSAAGRAEVVPGRVTGLADAAEWGPDVLVNATGAAPASEEALIASLVSAGSLRCAPGDAGVAVDAAFQAADGLFVFGPLLAGNANATVRVWHLESAWRIIELAPQAAAAVRAHLGATEALGRR